MPHRSCRLATLTAPLPETSTAPRIAGDVLGSIAVSAPANRSWGGVTWSPWVSFDEAQLPAEVPTTPGLYRFRTAGDETLLYIGIGANRRRRLRTLHRWAAKGSAAFVRVPGQKRPFRGHYAAPALARSREAGCSIEVSWMMDEIADKTERERVEASLITRHLTEAGAFPPWQHGGKELDDYLRGIQAS